MVEENKHNSGCVIFSQASDSDHDIFHYILYNQDFPRVYPNPQLAKVRMTQVVHWSTMWMGCACWGPFASADIVGAHILAEDSNVDKKMYVWQTSHSMLISY